MMRWNSRTVFVAVFLVKVLQAEDNLVPSAEVCREAALEVFAYLADGVTKHLLARRVVVARLELVEQLPLVFVFAPLPREVVKRVAISLDAALSAVARRAARAVRREERAVARTPPRLVVGGDRLAHRVREDVAEALTRPVRLVLADGERRRREPHRRVQRQPQGLRLVAIHVLK